MIVSIEQFNAYSGNYEDSDSARMIKDNFLQASEEIVCGYLGYDPTENDYTDILLSGDGTRKLYLPSRPVTMIRSLKINGSETSLDDVRCDDDRLVRTVQGQTFPRGEDNITVSFRAGWPLKDIPGVITLSIMRIATLMLSETGGNIGVSSKSFADNSRTFINYTNYRRYLEPLDTLRLARF